LFTMRSVVVLLFVCLVAYGKTEVVNQTLPSAREGGNSNSFYCPQGLDAGIYSFQGEYQYAEYISHASVYSDSITVDADNGNDDYIGWGDSDYSWDSNEVGGAISGQIQIVRSDNQFCKANVFYILSPVSRSNGADVIKSYLQGQTLRFTYNQNNCPFPAIFANNDYYNYFELYLGTKDTFIGLIPLPLNSGVSGNGNNVKYGAARAMVMATKEGSVKASAFTTYQACMAQNAGG